MWFLQSRYFKQPSLTTPDRPSTKNASSTPASGNNYRKRDVVTGSRTAQGASSSTSPSKQPRNVGAKSPSRTRLPSASPRRSPSVNSPKNRRELLQKSRSAAAVTINANNTSVQQYSLVGGAPAGRREDNLQNPSDAYALQQLTRPGSSSASPSKRNKGNTTASSSGSAAAAPSGGAVSTSNIIVTGGATSSTSNMMIRGPTGTWAAPSLSRGKRTISNATSDNTSTKATSKESNQSDGLLQHMAQQAVAQQAAQQAAHYQQQEQVHLQPQVPHQSHPGLMGAGSSSTAMQQQQLHHQQMQQQQMQAQIQQQQVQAQIQQQQMQAQLQQQQQQLAHQQQMQQQNAAAAQPMTGVVQEGDEEQELPDLGTSRFELRQFLGSGGEGVVYEAYDFVNQAPCALKVGNKTAQRNKGFEKEYAIYSHCVKHRVESIPRLFDTRIAALSPNGHLVDQNTKPDYLALELMGPSIRMMLQAVLSHRAHQADQGIPVPRSSTMELRSIYVIAEKMLETLEQLHRVKVLHHDVKPQNVVFRDRNRSLETDVVTDKDQLALIDLGMSYFVAENTKPKRHCRFCGSMDYSSRASRYRCQPSRRDDLESLGYLLLWLIMGNRSFKAWRSAVLEPYWEMLSVLFEDRPDISEIMSNPSRNGAPYSAALARTNDDTKVFIRRSAVQNCKKPDKKCDLGLFSTTMTTRPDDIIEGNFPKLNREKVPEKILYFVLYCQTLGFAEIPNYAGMKALFHRPSHTEGQELTIAASNAEPVPEWIMSRMVTHSLVKESPMPQHATSSASSSMADGSSFLRDSPFSLSKSYHQASVAVHQQQLSMHLNQQQQMQYNNNISMGTSNNNLLNGASSNNLLPTGGSFLGGQQSTMSVAQSCRQTGDECQLTTTPQRNPYVKFVSPLDDETFTLGDPHSGMKPSRLMTDDTPQPLVFNFFLGFTHFLLLLLCMILSYTPTIFQQNIEDHLVHIFPTISIL
ncbi:unnamed protein product [Amoebophrya sp. A25]|nr:unnamed protein product [Amoebophrya sp. A25]|eukprot:GSA25T00019640001.1